MNSKQNKKKKRLHGRVEKIIKPFAPNAPEKAQICIEEAEPLYREIRVENLVEDEGGRKARLKPKEEVDVVIEAEPDIPQDPAAGSQSVTGPSRS